MKNKNIFFLTLVLFGSALSKGKGSNASGSNKTSRHNSGLIVVPPRLLPAAVLGAKLGDTARILKDGTARVAGYKYELNKFTGNWELQD